MRQIGKPQLTVGLDTNDNTKKTVAIQVDQCDEAVIATFKNTGTHDTEVVEVWGALIKEDGTESDYFLIPGSDIVGLKCVTIDIKEYAFIYVKVKTAEGGTSTTDVLINPYIIN